MLANELITTSQPISLSHTQTHTHYDDLRKKCKLKNEDRECGGEWVVRARTRNKDNWKSKKAGSNSLTVDW